ncbi:MAG TPA: FG-GAP repeat protein, partial [Phycisphaerales bacterium]|nr:FG-GAP repeat protein [Phycisphaerales bacterium]
MLARTSVALTLSLTAGLACAQTCNPVSKLLGTSPLNDDNFGASVAMSFGGPSNAPLFAVGMPGEDAPGAGNNAGGFSIFQRINGWSTMTAAWNSTGQAGERMGASIGLADPYLIVGAPGYNSGQGRARIMRRPTGSTSYLLSTDVTILAPNSPAGAEFGSSVAISDVGGGWAVVGAPMHNWSGSQTGSAYFYVRDAATNQWTENFHVWGGDYGGEAGDRRGTSVAMSPNSPFAAVGIPFADEPGNPDDHGKVQIFERMANGNVSASPTTVRPPFPEAFENFGASVAISGDVLVVGAPGEDMTLQEGGFVQSATNGGAIYIFERNTTTNAWNFVAKLRSPLPVASGAFGTTVATDNLQIVVGEALTKRAYVFSKMSGSWQYQSTISDQDAPAGGSFANALAVRNGVIGIGDASDDDGVITERGAAYVLTMEQSQATGDLCTMPMTVTQNADFVGCTEFATASTGTVTTCGSGSSGNVAQGPDVWFRFSPSCDGNAIFDTFGSDFDTVLSVHSDCPTLFSGNTIVCNDDHTFAAPNNRASLVSFNFTGGETYLIRVSGYNGAKGQFTLRNLISYGVSNDNCSNAITVGQGTATFNTCSATDSNLAGSQCGTPRKDVWYRYISPSNGVITINTCGSSFDTVVNVYTGTQQACPANPLALVACNDDSTDICEPGLSRPSYVQFSAPAGESYMIRVGGFNSESGPGQMTITHTAGCDNIDFNNNSVFPE